MNTEHKTVTILDNGKAKYWDSYKQEWRLARCQSDVPSCAFDKMSVEEQAVINKLPVKDW